MLLALVQLVEREPPIIFLLPSSIHGAPNPILESRDYGEGKKSPPGWGPNAIQEEAHGKLGIRGCDGLASRSTSFDCRSNCN